MKRSKFSDSQILSILKQHEAGFPVSELAREYGVSTALIYQWRSKYGGMDAALMKRLKELEAENARLKKMYAEERIKAELRQEALEEASRYHITLLYIQPGKPTQNAYIERFNRTARHEWLDMHQFESIAHAQLLATQWLWHYNNERPNMAIGGIPPRKLLQAA